MLRKLDKDLWVIDHALTITGGIRIGTRTTLIRLSDGNIFAHAPGPTDDGDHIEIDKLGNITQIVAPNLFHNMNVADWVSRYGGATCHAPATFDTKVPGLPYETLSDDVPAAWSADIDQVFVQGAPQINETVFFHRATRTLLLTDLCFNMLHSESLITRVLMRVMGGYGHFGPSYLARTFMRDKNAIRRVIDRILEWDFDRVTVTHGQVLETGGRAKLEQAFAWL